MVPITLQPPSDNPFATPIADITKWHAGSSTGNELGHGQSNRGPSAATASISAVVPRDGTRAYDQPEPAHPGGCAQGDLPHPRARLIAFDNEEFTREMRRVAGVV